MYLILDMKCDDCDFELELVVQRSNCEIQRCSKCNGVMSRQVSAPGMVKTNFADKTGFKNR